MNTGDSPSNRAYWHAKQELHLGIEANKRRKCAEVHADINRDTWGLRYQIVTGKLHKRSLVGKMDHTIINKVVNDLFLNHPENTYSIQTSQKEISLNTVEELQKIANTLANGKALGPDGMPTEVIKTIAKEHPHLLLNMYKSCPKAGIFYSQ